MIRASTFQEWENREAARRDAISSNRSRRMRGMDQIPVPDRILPPLVYILLEEDGTYAGCVRGEENAKELVAMNPGWTMRQENAIR